MSEASPASRSDGAATGTRPTPRGVLAAAKRLRGHVRRTPLQHSVGLSQAAGTEVWLKLENLQHVGTFKVRGACNAAFALSDRALRRGIVTASAGNHGLGVALAARLRGARATVFLPEVAPLAKRRRIARLGAEVREVPGGYDDAHGAALEHASTSGALYLHAFSDPLVVEGQGTVGLEILEELPEVRTLLLPVGGGGLIGGVGLLARALDPTIRIVGVQSDATATMHASLEAGRVVSLPQLPTLCDGLAGDVDAASFALAREVVHEIILVTEREVRQSIQWLFVEEGLVAEGSAATIVAAIQRGAPSLTGPVAAVLSGGNLDAPLLAEILTE